MRGQVEDHVREGEEEILSGEWPVFLEKIPPLFGNFFSISIHICGGDSRPDAAGPDDAEAKIPDAVHPKDNRKWESRPVPKSPIPDNRHNQ